MNRRTIPALLALASITGCAARPNTKVVTAGTLAELRKVRPDVQEVKVEQGLDQAMLQYRRFLEDAPENTMTPEAMRRLADLQLEKQFGRAGDVKPREMPAPQPAPALAGANGGTPKPSIALQESDQDFERRTTAEGGIPPSSNAIVDSKGPLEAIALY